MPERKTIERARRDEREGKSASTQAGEFVREEMEHIREGKHGARSSKQAIAIGLSKARRAGVKLPVPRKGTASAKTRKKAARDLSQGRSAAAKKPSRRRSRAVKRALGREGKAAASRTALSRQARGAAKARKRRGPTVSTSGRKGSRSAGRAKNAKRSKRTRGSSRR